jgi:SAM-dependent methyltransferase
VPAADAVRWNRRYLAHTRATFAAPRPFLVEQAGWLPSEGLALDLAMGLGGNAAFLLARGLQVVGIDIADVAVHRAKARWPQIMAIVADLYQFELPAATFDAITSFYFLQRDLWPQIRRALRPGGVLIMETLTQAQRTVQADIDPQYLLQPGELHCAFTELDILVYREGWATGNHGHRRAVASLVARAPARRQAK